MSYTLGFDEIMKSRIKRLLLALLLLWHGKGLCADSKSTGNYFPSFMEVELSTSAIVLAPASFLSRGYGLPHVVDSPWSALGLNVGITIQNFTYRLGLGTFPFMWTMNTAAAVDWNIGDGKSGRVSPFAGVSYNYANFYRNLTQNSDNEFVLETAEYAFSMGYFLGVRFTSDDRSFGFGFRHDPILYKSGKKSETLDKPSADYIERTAPRVPYLQSWGVFGFLGWTFH